MRAPGGCCFAHLLAELGAADGPLPDAVVVGQHRWLGLLEMHGRRAVRRTIARVVT